LWNSMTGTYGESNSGSHTAAYRNLFSMIKK
jgi:hypothetical protein